MPSIPPQPDPTPPVKPGAITRHQGEPETPSAPCSTSPAGREDSAGAVPDWAADAVWYQVFVPRFRNGERSNDPPHTWEWTADWLRQPPDRTPDRVELYFRRYGGDLQGLREKLGYLQDLGINTIYLNPIFSAASEHKYDARDYRHVDDTLAVAGSLQPDDWSFNASDRLFLDLLAEAHQRGFRVVLDGVFNHVGREFQAFQELLNTPDPRKSPYANWFDITDFGPPVQWMAWDGPNGHLVRFRREGDGFDPEVEKHLFEVTRRWMDPDGDGDPSDGIDGWRLDAAEQVPHGFWKRWRKLVKTVNPNALILGEIWSNPSEWLQGDEFDVVTNYRLARAVVRFCRPDGDRFTATRFASELDSLLKQTDRARSHAMVSLLSSHDTDRLASMMQNVRRRYDRDNHPGAGRPPYDGGVPKDEAIQRLQLAVALQFTLPGAPMIYYGDEVGMYGGDDPYCRAPMWWPDLPAGVPQAYRPELREFYKRLIALRNRHKPLRQGRLRVVLADDARRVLCFERTLGPRERVITVVNGSADAHEVGLTIGTPAEPFRLTPLAGEAACLGACVLDDGGCTRIRCGPRSAALVVFRD